MTTKSLLIAGSILGALSLAGCPTETTTDAGTDAASTTDTNVMTDGGTPGSDAGPVTITCATYCAQLTTNCTGANAQYDSMADCMSYCDSAGWAVGTSADTSGNTLACRIYHGGVPAAGEPGEHCDHAGPGGDGVCGTTDFRTEATGYARVDRMGMPAVATALVSSAMKNNYNDGNPSEAAGGDGARVMTSFGMLPTWAPEFATNLLGIHMALNDDLAGLMLTPCGAAAPAGLGDILGCATQTVGAGGPAVLNLVAPDTLQIDTTAAAGFPNGRRLADPVIDVTLAVVLLDLRTHPATTFVTFDRDGAAGPIPAGLNPTRNDVAEGVFLTTFPYLHPAHTPAP
jgi:hypothetical protein